ncbi:RES domain-containing protein [Salinibacter ruber]
MSGARWNRLSAPMVYASDQAATALLETLAHVGRGALLQQGSRAFFC